MADQTRFRHIKVNAADDDVVIYAGVHTSAQSTDEAAEEAADRKDVAGSVQDVPDAREELQPESADDYHETTLEDIRASKMPTMQKAILVIAVVAIAAFAVWYMFFH